MAAVGEIIMAQETMDVLPLNQIILGNSLDVLKKIPDKSVDLIFADPPYNLQLQQELYRPNQTKVDAVNNDWDKQSLLTQIKDFIQASGLNTRFVMMSLRAGLTSQVGAMGVYDIMVLLGKDESLARLKLVRSG